MGEDRFGYIAFGKDELYARGALFSALRLLHYTPGARISVLTDRPGVFDGYPIEAIELTAKDMADMSFGDRYMFGIKAAGIIKLLQRCERLFVLDTDIYPVGDISGCFRRISPTTSIMYKREGRPKQEYRGLRGKGIALQGQEITGDETMWASGVLGVHHDNIPALERAYSTVMKVRDFVGVHTPEQFCTGIALSQEGRSITPHHLPIRNYTTRGRKLFARQRIDAFFEQTSSLGVSEQIEQAGRYRVWRAPLDLLMQRDIWHF
ncbi:hypothetical protein [Mesorhizobium sp. NZP2077]|uniref:hypothetical protein n=1 Tax=Mesorhizobium sp. NZP2077 TaxID=2483404 RepID=UPI0015567175|nr:hypothetical protein [Mesorhizobium sp. NZP2077]QKC80651.1 hypothetical protein EB232_02360 [Mesorhizobium sp. NZP2077]QKD14040.1 hypothetical protein HGP13_02345 [Mesorhizobium sp. NZP2077]